MRVLVCGGRDFSDREWLEEVLLEIHPTVVITGDAPGADRFAREWAYPVVPLEVYKAHWRQFGRSAGPKRNQRMLDEGKPDLVVAFPGGRGTADMVQRAKAAGIKVKQPESENDAL